MKTKIYLPILAIGAAAALAGCSENAWNDHLDGFDASFRPTEVKSIEYTLTAADYASIAGNATNKAIAADADVAQALAALSGNKYFSDKIDAATYVPAFLAATSPYMYYSDGSSVKLTYNVFNGTPAQATEASGAEKVTVPSEFYQQNVWESDDNYIDAFAPAKPASKFLPGYLKSALPDAEAGQYAYVTYQVAQTNPVFGNVGGGDEPTPGFTLSSTIGDLQPGDDAVITGVVAGVCTCGFVVTDASGSIFVYCGNGFNYASYPVGTQVYIDGSCTSYKNNIQIAAGAEIEVEGQQEYKFPAPVAYTGATLEAALSRPANVLAEYATVSGTVKINGSNINIEVAGAENAMGSVYYATDEQKAALTDGASVTLTGWFISISGTRYCNWLVTDIKSASGARKGYRAPVADVPAEVEYALYMYDGSKWSVPADFAVVEHADYVQMGFSSDAISGTASDYLPAFLRSKFPYAHKDDVKYALYVDGSGQTVCRQYNFDGAAWVYFNGVEVETAQFVKAEGHWMYDPNVTITLAYGKGIPASATFYQACVDWVYENKCVPLGDTSIKSGLYWVTSYGNNDYYCGTSAYQNNVDLRAASARNQYPAGWEGYTDEEIVQTMEDRCDKEVFPAVLGELYPDAKPVEGLTVVYTLNFYAYALTPAGSYKTLPCQAKYEVTAKGHFEYMESQWLIGME